MEIGIELPARNKIYLHPHITDGNHQSAYLISIKAFSLGIKQLDDKLRSRFHQMSNSKMYGAISPISYALQQHSLIKLKTT
jgi:hypothetical protein